MADASNTSLNPPPNGLSGFTFDFAQEPVLLKRFSEPASNADYRTPSPSPPPTSPIPAPAPASSSRRPSLLELLAESGPDAATANDAENHHSRKRSVNGAGAPPSSSSLPSSAQDRTMAVTQAAPSAASQINGLPLPKSRVDSPSVDAAILRYPSSESHSPCIDSQRRGVSDAPVDSSMSISIGAVTPGNTIILTADAHKAPSASSAPVPDSVPTLDDIRRLHGDLSTTISSFRLPDPAPAIRMAQESREHADAAMTLAENVQRMSHQAVADARKTLSSAQQSLQVAEQSFQAAEQCLIAAQVAKDRSVAAMRMLQDFGLEGNRSWNDNLTVSRRHLETIKEWIDQYEKVERSATMVKAAPTSPLTLQSTRKTTTQQYTLERSASSSVTPGDGAKRGIPAQDVDDALPEELEHLARLRLAKRDAYTRLLEEEKRITEARRARLVEKQEDARREAAKEEARRKAEEARRHAEEARRQAEEEKKRQAEEEKHRQLEEEKKREQEEAARRARLEKEAEEERRHKEEVQRQIAESRKAAEEHKAAENAEKQARRNVLLQKRQREQVAQLKARANAEEAARIKGARAAAATASVPPPDPASSPPSSAPMATPAFPIVGNVVARKTLASPNPSSKKKRKKQRQMQQKSEYGPPTSLIRATALGLRPDSIHGIRHTSIPPIAHLDMSGSSVDTSQSSSASTGSSLSDEMSLHAHGLDQGNLPLVPTGMEPMISPTPFFNMMPTQQYLLPGAFGVHPTLDYDMHPFPVYEPYDMYNYAPPPSSAPTAFGRNVPGPSYPLDASSRPRLTAGPSATRGNVPFLPGSMAPPTGHPSSATNMSPPSSTVPGQGLEKASAPTVLSNAPARRPPLNDANKPSDSTHPVSGGPSSASLPPKPQGMLPPKPTSSPIVPPLKMSVPEASSVPGLKRGSQTSTERQTSSHSYLTHNGPSTKSRAPLITSSSKSGVSAGSEPPLPSLPTSKRVPVPSPAPAPADAPESLISRIPASSVNQGKQRLRPGLPKPLPKASIRRQPPLPKPPPPTEAAHAAARQPSKEKPLLSRLQNDSSDISQSSEYDVSGRSSLEQGDGGWNNVLQAASFARAKSSSSQQHPAAENHDKRDQQSTSKKRMREDDVDSLSPPRRIRVVSISSYDHYSPSPPPPPPRNSRSQHWSPSPSPEKIPSLSPSPEDFDARPRPSRYRRRADLLGRMTDAATPVFRGRGKPRGAIRGRGRGQPPGRMSLQNRLTDSTLASRMGVFLLSPKM
ncbi:hypothetical protein FISHEDRAFT_76747 [Fistulina hepatica ATCC 64428]|uniref:Uncharacterized protein n=1 Tax=Fistulina hepatica ATCC 64428 TaxID=1128425 RepID=A0A0D7A3C1_9AGAR|nr:hypothetical protein FISHEDRAFT_76747 [Fistulina hepatica ATCC 64428]